MDGSLEEGRWLSKPSREVVDEDEVIVIDSDSSEEDPPPKSAHYYSVKKELCSEEIKTAAVSPEKNKNRLNKRRLNLGDVNANSQTPTVTLDSDSDSIDKENPCVHEFHVAMGKYPFFSRDPLVEINLPLNDGKNKKGSYAKSVLVEPKLEETENDLNFLEWGKDNDSEMRNADDWPKVILAADSVPSNPEPVSNVVETPSLIAQSICEDHRKRNASISTETAILATPSSIFGGTTTHEERMALKIQILEDKHTTLLEELAEDRKERQIEREERQKEREEQTRKFESSLENQEFLKENQQIILKKQEEDSSILKRFMKKSGKFQLETKNNQVETSLANFQTNVAVNDMARVIERHGLTTNSIGRAEIREIREANERNLRM